MLNIEKKKSNEVRISVEMYRDPDGHGRGVAVDGRNMQGHVKQKIGTFHFVYP